MFSYTAFEMLQNFEIVIKTKGSGGGGGGGRGGDGTNGEIG